MFRSLFALAVQGTMRKKRSSILVFLTLLLSFSCAIVSLSITESMRYTNAEYRYTTFGEWYIALPYTKAGERAWVEAQDWTKEIGTATVYGRLKLSGISRTFGTADSSYLSLGRVELVEGRMPRKDDEVAVTEEVLHALEALCGGTLTPGDKVPIPAAADEAAPNGSAARSYTLCGVIADYGKLWDLRRNVHGEPLLGAVMTAGGAQALQNAAGGGTPVEQLFIRVDRGERLDAAQQVKDYLRQTRAADSEDLAPCVNDAAYPRGNEAVASDEVYAMFIAAVALAAVLCIYLMNLPTEVHSFAVLRSIGITRGQLLALMGLESLLLTIPAVLLGIPLGALLTKLALRLLVYSGSVAIQVSVPYGMLKTLFALWLAAILLARLIIFFVTVRTPLTGRMQLQQRKARRATHLRRALVALLLVGFCATAVYSAGASRYPTYRVQAFSKQPDYGVINEASTPEFAETLRGIEGIESVEGFMSLHNGSTYASPICISFEGLAERRTNLFMIDERYWQGVFDFGSEAEAFHNGDIIYLFFSNHYIGQKPSGAQDPSVRYEWPDCPQPSGDVTVRVCIGSKCLAEVSVASRSLYSEDMKLYGRTGATSISTNEPYTVICSEGFVRRLLDGMEPGTEWECFVAGESFAYQSLWLTADANAADLSAYYAVNTLVRSEYGRTDCVLDQSEEKQAEIQNQTQTLILLYACGGCIAFVTLLLLAGALALEAEQERRSYSILRVIGMSKRQMQRRVFGKALLRGILAIAAGWTAYAVLCIRTQLVLNKCTLVEAARYAWDYFTYYGGGLPFVAILSAAMLAVLLAVSLLAKRGLKQNTLLK